MEKLFDKLRGAKNFSNIELKFGYYKSREELIPKTTFLKHKGL